MATRGRRESPKNQEPADTTVVPAPPPTAVTVGNPYLDPFKDQIYYNDPTFQNIVKSYESRASQFGANNIDPVFQQVSGYADIFKNQFKNYVGRDPNADEYSQFFKSLQVEAPWQKEANAFGGIIGEKTKGILQDYYSNVAADEATKKAEGQVNQALAPGSAFDTWQNSYRSNVSEVEKSLQDYQTRLFEKLRPQLLTSLQSQGLLNTGALNEAFAGAAGDLASEGANFSAQAKAAAEQDISNKRYEIAASPGNFALQNTFNRVPNLYQSGQTALNNVFNSYLQDQSFQNQMRLLERQRAEQPSVLSQLAGQMAGGLATGLGQRLGGGGGGSSGGFGGYNIGGGRTWNPYANPY